MFAFLTEIMSRKTKSEEIHFFYFCVKNSYCFEKIHNNAKNAFLKIRIYFTNYENFTLKKQNLFIYDE